MIDTASETKLVIALSEPDEWKKFQVGEERPFYADPRIVGARIRTVYEAAHILESLDFRGPSDREYNAMASEDPEIAEQMKKYFTFTGILKNVREKRYGYLASLIARPEFTEKRGRIKVAGPEKRITLPPRGWFKVEDLPEDGTGLPQRTYKKLPEEPCAYSMIQTGQRMAILRGRSYSRWGHEETRFAFSVFRTPEQTITNLGLLAVSDIDPRPIPET